MDNIMYDVSDTPRDGYVFHEYIRKYVALKREWRELFEEFPDRFVIGLDIDPTRWKGYDQFCYTFRKVVLASLKRDVAEKMAYKNAWKLMTGEEWLEQSG